MTIGMVLACRVIGLSLQSSLLAIRSATVASGVMGIVVTIWRLSASHTLGAGDLLILLGSVVLGVLSYCLSLWVIRDTTVPEVATLIWAVLRPSELHDHHLAHGCETEDPSSGIG